MVLFDYVFNLGCDFFKDKIIDEDGRRALRKKLEAYFLRKHIGNYDCSLDDEIDLTGLVEYISQELHGKIEKACLEVLLKKGIKHTRILLIRR